MAKFDHFLIVWPDLTVDSPTMNSAAATLLYSLRTAMVRASGAGIIRYNTPTCSGLKQDLYIYEPLCQRTTIHMRTGLKLMVPCSLFCGAMHYPPLRVPTMLPASCCESPGSQAHRLTSPPQSLQKLVITAAAAAAALVAAAIAAFLIRRRTPTS